MKSGKQRRREIKTARRLRATKAQQALIEHLPLGFSPTAAIAVNPALLASYNSYGEPLFLACGWYQDQPFRCIDCGKDEVLDHCTATLVVRSGTRLGIRPCGALPTLPPGWPRSANTLNAYGPIAGTY